MAMRIVLADDHAPVRRALRSLLEAEKVGSIADACGRSGNRLGGCYQPGNWEIGCIPFR
jgi:hypothetical protein